MQSGLDQWVASRIRPNDAWLEHQVAAGPKTRQRSSFDEMCLEKAYQTKEGQASKAPIIIPLVCSSIKHEHFKMD